MSPENQWLEDVLTTEIVFGGVTTITCMSQEVSKKVSKWVITPIYPIYM